MKFPEIPNPKSLLQRIAERDDLDYKAQINPSQKGTADFIKDVSAMSNIGGGVLVFGVKGRELLGISDEELLNYDASRLDGKIKQYLSPTPQLSTEVVTHEGKAYPFVKIGGITKTPIVVSGNLNDEKSKQLLKPGSVYVRQNTATIEVSSADLMRQLIDRIVDLGGINGYLPSFHVPYGFWLWEADFHNRTVTTYQSMVAVETIVG